jgi:hypothetical protein
MDLVHDFFFLFQNIFLGEFFLLGHEAIGKQDFGRDLAGKSPQKVGVGNEGLRTTLSKSLCPSFPPLRWAVSAFKEQQVRGPHPTFFLCSTQAGG